MIGHLQSKRCSQNGTELNKTWIEALEWVLGDEAQRAAYADWLKAVRDLAGVDAPAFTVTTLAAAEAFRRGSRLAVLELLTHLE